MKIKELYSKDIDRQINPAVVVSKQDEATVKTEIEEYVFTPATLNNLYTYLDTIINSKQDKTGIWINGFYGSGKSHFIKYIYYCLNPKYSSQAFKHFIEEAANDKGNLTEATPSNISGLQSKLNKMLLETIIFNIDAVAGQVGNREKITKVFFNQFNTHRGFNGTNIQLAILLESHLDQMNLFDEFKKQIFEKQNVDWNKDAARIVSLKLSSVLSIAKEVDPSLDVEALGAKLLNPDDLTIADHLIPEIVDYLKKQPDNYKMIFLVDEISQYIGSNTSLLLNLQTIVEEFSSKCSNKVWVSCTAQQTIDDFVKNTENTGEDLGKILGRFETRISLESQNTTYITQKRILDKNSEGEKLLREFYSNNKESIDNQFLSTHDRYKGFSSKEEFVLSYPFVPYQFHLIADVFENFASLGYVIKEVKDNERSILGITHYTAKEHGNADLGGFITFDLFFNNQMRNNVTHRANSILDPALSAEGIKDNSFAKKVVYTLFMISNISDTKKLTFPTNMDNLILLLLNNQDVNRLELQNKIQKVLDILIEKTIIYNEDGKYYFFKEEEIDVAKQIANQTITLDDRLSFFYDDILQVKIKPQRKADYGNNTFTVSLFVDDKQVFANGEFNIIFSVFDNLDAHRKAISVNKNDLVICINEWFMKDNSLRDEFMNYVRTKKFLKLNLDSASGTRKIAAIKFGDQNTKKLEDLKRRIETNFSSTNFVSDNQVIHASEINGATAADIYKNAIEKHLSEIYKKNNLANSYASTNEKLRQSGSDGQILADTSLSSAELTVNSYIDSLGDLTVDDVIKQFKKQPYGWKDLSTIDILIYLFKKNKRKFEWRSDPVDLKEFVEKALKANERTALVIKSVEDIGTEVIKDARSAYTTIFNKTLIEDSDPNLLFAEIKKNIKIIAEENNRYNGDYTTTPFGIHFSNFSKILGRISEIRDQKELFEYLIKYKDANKELNDKCKETVDFISNQYSKYQVIKDFANANLKNFDALEDTDLEKAEILKKYFLTDDMPGEKFPQINKIHKELSVSLKDLVGDLLTKAKGIYEVLYKDIERQAEEMKVAEPGVYTAKDYKLNSIAKLSNISDLRFEISNADEFKSKSIQDIIEFSNRRNGGDSRNTVVITGLDTVIKNEEDLDRYISKLRERLLAGLKENKILIIK